jgi:hypothetical protein
MAQQKKKQCGWTKASHNLGSPKPVSPGTSQRVCKRCGRVFNVKCGTFFSPHRFKRDRRIKNKRVVKCKNCGLKKTL